MDGEGAGIDVADRIDQAYHPARPAQVQPGERPRRTEPGQVEEGVARQHAVTAFDEPVVELHLLLGGGVQFVPHVGTTARRAEARYPQRSAVTRCQSSEFVELVDIVSGDDDGDLRVFEPSGSEVLQRADGHRERALPTHRIVDFRGRSVE